MTPYEHPLFEGPSVASDRQPASKIAKKLLVEEALFFHDPHPEHHSGEEDERALMQWIQGGGAQEFGKFWAEHANDPDVKKAISGWDTHPDTSLQVLERAWRQFEQEQRNETLE